MIDPTSSTPGCALITGASAGIGAAFARQLAAQGYRLILSARRVDRLRALATELSAVPVEIFPADLTQPADVQRLAERIAAEPDLTLLINNAGFGKQGRFWESDPQGQFDMAQVHMMAVVQLTRAALPNMTARGRGAMINVSSVAAFLARGSGAMYHASKAFLNAFSEGLNAELRGTGVHVQALCPGFTITEFHSTPEYKDFRRSRIPGFLWMSADQVVKESLADLRRERGLCVPGWYYKFAVALISAPLIRPLAQWTARKFVRTG